MREPPPTIDFRLMLFDAERRLLLGRPEMAQDATLKPILWQQTAVGYLGYVPRTGLAESFQRVYAQQQHWLFAAIALGMLAAALLLGAGLAQWLTRRVRALAAGTAQLILGNYDARVDEDGHDEIAQLARDFNNLAQTLSSTERARRQWVADIAHELRTPLAVLRGETEALQDGVRQLNPQTLASLAQEVARLGRLVEDLHLLSLSDLGALTYYRDTIDLGETLEDAINAQRRSLDERHMRVKLESAPGIMVWADATRLAQVFGNLMQNTLRYTAPPGELSIVVHRAGDRAIVDWQDSSPGVSENDLPRLGERLYRVDASRSRDGGGSGLGLAIAKAIIEAHGGSMTVRSSTLGGLWWQICLPVHSGARKAVET
jgi:two-component system sensor histidine kinase BaeS